MLQYSRSISNEFDDIWMVSIAAFCYNEVTLSKLLLNNNLNALVSRRSDMLFFGVGKKLGLHKTKNTVTILLWVWLQYYKISSFLYISEVIDYNYHLFGKCI